MKYKSQTTPLIKKRLLGIVNHESNWHIPFNVQQSFYGVETRAPTIEEYNDFTNIIYMTSDNRWDPSNIQLTHHSSVIGTLKCSHSDKYTDNSEYDIMTGSVYSIYTSRLAEGLSY